MTLCGEPREAGWSLRNNVKPGTPMGRGLPRVLVGFGRCSGRCPGRWYLPLFRTLSRSLTSAPVYNNSTLPDEETA